MWRFQWPRRLCHDYGRILIGQFMHSFFILPNIGLASSFHISWHLPHHPWGSISTCCRMHRYWHHPSVSSCSFCCPSQPLYPAKVQVFAIVLLSLRNFPRVFLLRMRSLTPEDCIDFMQWIPTCYKVHIPRAHYPVYMQQVCRSKVKKFSVLRRPGK